MDNFNDIRDHDPEKYYMGNTGEVMLGSLCLGIIKIVGITDLRFGKLTDAISYINIGKPVYHQAQLLNRMYNNGQPLLPQTRLDLLTVSYEKQNVDVIGELLDEWYITKKQKQ